MTLASTLAAGRGSLRNHAFSKSSPSFKSLLSKRYYSSWKPSWATIDPASMGELSEPYKVSNLVNGKWEEECPSGGRMVIPDPMNKDSAGLFSLPDTKSEDLAPFVDSMKACTKTGLHNPLKNNERYIMYGEVSRKAAEALKDPEIAKYFAHSIMKCVPKSEAQALGEVSVTSDFLANFGGDNVRFLARDFGVPGNHMGQKSVGHRWPYGPVAIIAPFNFPLEIPVLQLMGALYMGNKPVLKPAEKVSVVMEQYIRLLHDCGMPMTDVDFLNCQGQVASDLIDRSPIRIIQFTGSSKVAELLSEQTRGKVKVEDAGFDWKILGPDVGDIDYVAWQCDQDAYAAQGQKCSAQSMMFCHENWTKAGILEKIEANAAKRSLKDMTIGPVLTHTTKSIMDHKDRLLQIPGAKVLFGGNPITEGHNCPDAYAVVEPTAVFVPLDEMMKDEHFDACVTEIFGPFQVVTEYSDAQTDTVLAACERMSHHLTAAVVSNDLEFNQKVLGNTVNGTTYAGRRARTTGAPQNHWFGPAGDPRGAGIGTPEAIKLVWSCHREIINDDLVPKDWTQPQVS